MASGITGRRKWIVTVLGGFGLIILFSLGARKVFSNRSHQATTAVAATEPPAQTTPAIDSSVPTTQSDPSGAGSSNESASNSEPSSASVPSVSGGTTCYDSKPFLEHFDLTSETRGDFAEKLAKAMPNDNVTVSASGDDNQYLLFVSQPENTSSLQEVFVVTNTPKTRANFCMQGFAEAQFIVVNPDTSQTLLFKLPTNLDDTLQYAAHHYAVPMQ